MGSDSFFSWWPISVSGEERCMDSSCKDNWCMKPCMYDMITISCFQVFHLVYAENISDNNSNIVYRLCMKAIPV